MKVIATLKLNRLIIAAACVLIILAEVLVIKTCFYAASADETAAVGALAQNDRFEVRSRLLMEATDYVGACSGADAADVWANGLELRSAAMQYAVMDAALKEEYARQLEQSAPNWVTGVSSPWVESYEITKAETLSDTVCRYTLRVSTLASTGPAGDYSAQLTVQKEGKYWRITRIQTDEGLYPYTRFKPPQ